MIDLTLLAHFLVFKDQALSGDFQYACGKMYT